MDTLFRGLLERFRKPRFRFRNRRRGLRFHTNLPFLCRHQGVRHQVYLVEVSARGARVRVQNLELPVDGKVRLIRPKGGLRLRCRVAHRQDTPEGLEYGLRFTHPQEAVRNSWHEKLMERLGVEQRKDRREWLRYSGRAGVVRVDFGENACDARLLNVSPGGVLLQCSQGRVGNACTVTFTDRCRVAGWVVAERETQDGRAVHIRFAKARKERKYLRRFIRDLAGSD